MAQAKRKKKFFDVEIPILKKETQLLAYEVKDLNERLMKYDLTRVLKGKSILLQMRIKVDEGKAVAFPEGINLMPYFLKKMIRKGTNYVEDSFSAECKDAKLKIKSFLITRRKVSRAVRKSLREKAREEIISYTKNKDSMTIFDDILKNHLQKNLSLILKKIYPLSLCEIRFLRIERKSESKE